MPAAVRTLIEAAARPIGTSCWTCAARTRRARRPQPVKKIVVIANQELATVRSAKRGWRRC